MEEQVGRRRQRRRTLAGVSVAGILVIGATDLLGGLLEDFVSPQSVIKIEVAGILALFLIVANLLLAQSETIASETQETSVRTAERFDELAHSMEVAIRGLQGSMVLLTDDDVDRAFSRAARSAKYRVYTCYTRPRPPQPEAGSTVQTGGSLLEIIRQKRNVHFRRVVLSSPGNSEWIGQLVKSLRGQANASLGELNVRDHELVLSIQLIDKDQVFIYGLVEGPPGRARHVLITDERAVSLMDDYYERLWQTCDLLLDNGVEKSAGSS